MQNSESPFINSHRIPLNNEKTSVVCILFEKTYIIFFNPWVSLKAAGCGFSKGGQLCCDIPDKSVYPMESLAGFIV